MLRTIVLAFFRGTGYANDLTATHSLYRIFQKYAVTVVQSPQSFILWTAVLTLALSYPILYELSHKLFNLPSQSDSSSWLSYDSGTQSLLCDTSGVIPDISVRQAYIKGGALTSNQEVFDLAWKIQNKLVDGIPLSDCVLLSPTAYWDNSLANFRDDPNHILTINNHIHDVTLNPYKSHGNVVPPQSVFSRLHRRDDHTVTFDALIISLFYRADAKVSNKTITELWDNNVKSALDTLSKECDVHSSKGQKAKVKFIHKLTPMTWRGNTLLALSYVCLAIYVVLSLKQVKAIRSRTGLLIAFVVEMLLSLAGATTTVQFFQLEMATIPLQAFPFMFVVVSTENMFRLVNSLSYTAPEQPATVRIGTALGKVGFLSSVSVGVNVCLLFVAMLLCAAPVRQFCFFSIVAIVIDFFLHMTYFMAVLSIDVRRLELEDLISTSRTPSIETDDSDEEEELIKVGISWNLFPKVAAFFSQGNVPTTTTAGTVLLGCYILLMQIHYAGDVDYMSIVRILRWKNSDAGRTTSAINYTAVPASEWVALRWLQVHEHLIGDDVFATLLPERSSFAIQFYAPDTFTLKSATEGVAKSVSTSAAGYFVRFMAVISVVALTTALLLEYMLRNVRDEHTSDLKINSNPVFVTKDLSGYHSLDVVRLATCTTGTVASVGLDHKLLLWQVNSRRRHAPTKVPLPADAWPVTNVELDSDGRFLAVCTRIAAARFTWQVKLSGLINTAPCAVLFLTEKVPGMVTKVNMVIVGRNGVLYQIATDSGGAVFEHRISDVPLVAAKTLFTPRLPKRIVSCSREGFVTITMLVRTTWMTHNLDLRPSVIIAMEQQSLPVEEQAERVKARELPSLIPLPQIGMVLRARGIYVDMIDVQTGTIVKEFQVAPYRRGTLRAFHDQPQHCPFCGCSTVGTLCILYSEKETGRLVMHSFVNSNKARRNICLRVERDPREKRCIGFEGVTERQHWLEDAAGWEVTDINIVMGIRRKKVLESELVGGEIKDERAGLRARRRRGVSEHVPKLFAKPDDEWEGWTMSMDGTVATYELRPEEVSRERFSRSRTRRRPESSDEDAERSSTPSGSSSRKRHHRNQHEAVPVRDEQNLLMSHLGPVAKLGHRSSVVGFGNTVKVLYFDKAEIISPAETDVDEDDVGLAYVSSRRRRADRRSNSKGSFGSVGASPNSRLSMRPAGRLMSGGRGGLMSGGARF
ncbi:sterol-sensing domain of SREBP cleavage-activation-domain-containing protein [Lipomyces arxii]|uniref:sterol-sensing domain of SREBP cleavage-activation-domain-containing protein n=1 Tax=Lipomyces arxii TaxID=56418 RepID=UPI0034CE0CCB